MKLMKKFEQFGLFSINSIKIIQESQCMIYIGEGKSSFGLYSYSFLSYI